MNILWIIVIGFLAGVIARFLAPGPNNPQGFILTTILGIVGAFLATFIGQTVGWYRLDQGAGLIGAGVLDDATYNQPVPDEQDDHSANHGSDQTRALI